VSAVTVRASVVSRVLGAVAAILVVAHVIGQVTKHVVGYPSVYGLVPLFDLDLERNVPSLFSTLLLFCAAMLLALITAVKSRDGDPDGVKWAILSLGFLFMTVDEAVGLHETLTLPVRTALGEGRLGIFNYAWVVAGLVVVAIVGVTFFGFLFRLPPKTRRRFIVAATVYLGGALGVELITGAYAERYATNTLAYTMVVGVEETLEMAGSILFIRALLLYLGDRYRELHVRFE
jgi:hypothetical protein